MIASFILGCCILIINTFASNIDNVDVFIGTYGEGYGVGGDPPGAQVPFGMVRLSPDTVAWDDIFIPWNHCGGYYWGDENIRVFSHTHMVGSGVLDYGTIAVMPISSSPSSDIVSDYGFRSSFDKSSEKAFPGYYTAYLADWNIQAELTATMHVGVHRYNFTTHQAGNEDMFILFPVSHSLGNFGPTTAGFQITVDPTNNEVYGYNYDKGSLSERLGGVTTYFVAHFSQSFTGYGTWNGDNVQSNSESANGTTQGGGAWVSFDGQNPVVEVYVGISFISVDQARTNLVAEISNMEFSEVQAQTTSQWANLLDQIQISGSDDNEITKFYSFFYHTLQAPTTFSEVGGYYLGFDDKVHQLPSNQSAYYTDMSIWDVHRTQFPWLALFQPDVLQDIVSSLVLMYKEGGDLPRWPFANGYTGCMFGQHAVIADAYLKNITGFDVQSAYEAMKLGATTNRQNNGRTALQDWLTIGFIPYDQSNTGACLTLAYSYDDWAISNLARVLGYNDDAETFLNRSRNWKNVWNSEYQFFCPKTTSGQWQCPPTWIDVFDSRYVEGDAWHYRFCVPEDIPELIDAFGQDNFVEQLANFFSYSEDDYYNVLPNPYYWAGNEEDLLAVWEFNWAGRADLTQLYSRWLLENKYTSAPDGIPGNDDYGTMSAWYVFGALGFYPLSGSPLFDKAVVNTPRGVITVIAHNNSDTNIYVQQVQLNGKVLQVPFISHDQLLGSIIEFWMTDQPTSTYGDYLPKLKKGLKAF